MAETYKWLYGNTVVKRGSDGAFIPTDITNNDYQAYLAWVSEGGVTSTADPLPSAADILADLRAGAIIELMSDTSSNAKILRGVLLLTMSELNLLRQWIEAFKATTALASSLTDLKTRVAALSAMPDRTAAQLKTAVLTIVNAGSAD